MTTSTSTPTPASRADDRPQLTAERLLRRDHVIFWTTHRRAGPPVAGGAVRARTTVPSGSGRVHPALDPRSSSSRFGRRTTARPSRSTADL